MKRRTSCDACSLRKTKCDLTDILQGTDGAQSSRLVTDNATCSFCRSLNLTCRITGNNKQRREGNPHQLLRKRLATGSTRRKCGKRIRKLLENENGRERVENSAIAGEEETNERNSGRPSEDVTSRRSNARLFDVQGLNVSILHACIDAYFSTMGVWMETSQPESVLRARVKVLLRHVQGLDMGDDDTSEEEPVGTEILVLAIAARGARCSSYAHLFEPLTDRFVRLIQHGDLLTQSDLDGMEAVTILHEGFFRPLHPISKQGSLPTCLTLDPLGKGFPTEFCLFLGLHQRSDDQIRRRSHIFWTVYVIDAIRSASACRMYRLQEEDIGWTFPSPPEKHHSLHLGLLARKMCRVLFSARAKLVGLQSDNVQALLDELISWPERCAISTSLVPGAESSSPVSMSVLPRRHMIAHAVKLAMWLRLFLSIWTSIHSIQATGLPAPLIDRVERETSTAAQKILELAEVCVKHDLVDCGSTLLVSTFAAWFLFFLQRNRHHSASSAHHLVAAVSSARHTKGAEALAKTLERMSVQGIQKGRLTVSDISRAAEAGRMPDEIVQRSALPSAVRIHSGLSTLAPDDPSPFPSEDEQRFGAAANANPQGSHGPSTENFGMLAWDPDLLTFLDAFMAQS